MNRTLHVGDVRDQERGRVRATSGTHAGDHADVVADAVLQNVRLRRVVVDTVDDEIGNLRDQRADVVLRDHHVVHRDLHVRIELQNVVTHDLHFGLADVLASGHGMSVQRRHRHDVEVD